MQKLEGPEKRMRNIVLAIGMVFMLGGAFVGNRAVTAAIKKRQAANAKQAVSEEAVKAELVNEEASMSPEAELEQIAAKLNETLPRQLDAATRLESSSAEPGLQLHYFSTLLDGEQSADENFAENINGLRARLIEDYRDSAEMKRLRDLGVTLVYIYKDEAGNELARIEISPADLAN